MSGLPVDTVMPFFPDSLFHRLQQQPRPAAYVVAYSGGLDSHVLLDALVRLRVRHGVPVSAVHVNHGLLPAADDWQTHCAAVCHALCVTVTMLNVNARAAHGESPEAAARAARYRALADWLPAGHCLLTAQHQDDQAETVLLQLLRGSGVHGLAAMPEYSTLGAGHLMRPLLPVTRKQLQQYAEQQQLRWIEDPSNTDTAFTRNFLRHAVMDRLRARWPRVSDSLSRTAANMADAAYLLDELADADLALLEQDDHTLEIAALRTWSPARQRNVLRCWLRRHTGAVPSRAVLSRVIHDLLQCRPDAGPCVRWAALELRRYRSRLYLLRQLDAGDTAQVLHWSLDVPLQLPGSGGELRAVPVTGRGIRQAVLTDAGVEVRWRQGGERCRPGGRGHHHALKKLLQEASVPPWQRSLIPLIYVNGELAAVPGLWVCEPFQAHAGEPGLQVQWKPPSLQLQEPGPWPIGSN